jgi:putative aldouronate transport system permease protein
MSTKTAALNADVVLKTAVRKKTDVSLIVIIICLIVWGLVVLFPFYNAIMISLVPQRIYIKEPLLLYPKELTFQSYGYVLGYKSIIAGFQNTLFIAVVGVTYNILLTVSAAYALTKPIPGRRLFTALIMFTMFFQGGLLPGYLMITGMGLTNSLWAMILPTGISIFNMMIMQSYFRTLSPEFEESAKIDGASELRILISIILPLSKPMLATIALYYAVDRWNEWYNAMLFMQKTAKWPLQYIIRQMLSNASMVLAGVPVDQRKQSFSNGIQMAAIVVTMLPIMCVYPFLQRYFVKGITLGGVKG